MLITKGYKYRIYPNNVQAEYINNIFGSCRFVHNHFLEIRSNEWKDHKKSVSYKDTSRILTLLKSEKEYAWLKACDSMALQKSLKDLDKAFRNFFAKRGKYPRFKNKHSHKQSYKTRNQNNCVRIYGRYILIPKIGKIKIRLSRSFDSRILNATVSKSNTGKYYVSLCVEEELIPKCNAGGIVSIDMGITDFYTEATDIGKKIPKY